MCPMKAPRDQGPPGHNGITYNRCSAELVSTHLRRRPLTTRVAWRAPRRENTVGHRQRKR
eukprot:149207-Prorocentrum_minimum.AAC.1